MLIYLLHTCEHLASFQFEFTVKNATTNIFTCFSGIFFWCGYLSIGEVDGSPDLAKDNAKLSSKLIVPFKLSPSYCQMFHSYQGARYKMDFHCGLHLKLYNY